MFKELISKLRLKRKQLVDKSNTFEPVPEKTKEFEILLSKQDNFYKMEISDYITISDYVERMQEIDHFNIEPLVGNAVLWNSQEQRVNKGTIYIIVAENTTYNILLAGNNIKIDERVKLDDRIVERYVRLDTDSNDYGFSLHHHDNTGDTFYTRFYNKKGHKFGKLELTDEEFLEEIKSLIDNLESIDGIDNIFDINLLKSIIANDFGDIKKKVL